MTNIEGKGSGMSDTAHERAIEAALEADLAFWENPAPYKALQDGKSEMEIGRESCRAMIEAYNAAMGEAQEWQRIETAPKDGSEFLVCRMGFGGLNISSWGVCRPQEDGYRANGGLPCWRNSDKDKMIPIPTHWMPCPQPPKDSGHD